MLPAIQIEGRAIADPELKFSQAGKAYARFTVVADKKKKNEATGEWEDDKVFFGNVTVFGKAAENVAASIQKGTNVTVVGRIETRNYEKTDGTKGTSVDITADYVGVALTWDPALVQKGERSIASKPTADNPWSSAPSTEAPPF